MSDEWKPGVLVGAHVRLEPLTRTHAADLAEAAADGELWNLWYTTVPRRGGVAAWIDAALAEQSAGSAIPFAVRAADGAIVGATRYMNIDAANRRLEIGHTWYAKRAQRTGVNTEAKRLLLAYGFERLGLVAVEFRTHWMNHASRRAIERLGAHCDGILRSHRIMPDGSLRDTVVYSILAHEWPAVRTGLDAALARHAHDAAGEITNG